MDNIGYGFQLMAVGMTTVFIILFIVIYGGKLLIKAVNKFAPAEVVAANKAATTSTPQTIDATTKSILDKVVEQLTNGKGRISSVKRI